MRRIGFILLISLLPVGGVVAQGLPSQKAMATTATPGFEVATIKPTDPASPNQGFHLRGRRFEIENESVISLIMFAYSVHQKQIVHAPSWLSERFDISGVPDTEGTPSLRQQQEMLQKLLKERFGFNFHIEKRDLAIYALRRDKSAARLPKASGDPDDLPDQTGNGNGNTMTMHFTNNSMADFALGMQYFMDKPVIDETNLAGRFDFTLRWTTGLAQNGDSDVPGMFTAIREQLGLRLEATHGATDVLVVDQVERPSAN